MVIHTTVSHTNLSFISNLERPSERENTYFTQEIKEEHSAVFLLLYTE